MRPTHRETLFRILKRIGIDRILNLYKQVTGSITTLCLHRVADAPDLCWPPLPVRVFDELMAHVARRFEVIPLSGLSGYIPGKRPGLVLSFDDGYADFIEHAQPILRKHGLPAVHNVVVECVQSGRPIWTQRLNHLFDTVHERRICKTIQVLGVPYSLRPDPRLLIDTNLRIYKALLIKEAKVRETALRALEAQFDFPPRGERMMGWDDLRACMRDGTEIGSHTMTHSLLCTLKSPEALSYELGESRRILSEKLAVPIDTVAFPNGEYDENVVAASLAAGYRRLLTVDGTWLPARTLSLAPQVIPRILVRHTGLYENLLGVENFHNLVKQVRASARA